MKMTLFFCKNLAALTLTFVFGAGLGHTSEIIDDNLIVNDASNLGSLTPRIFLLNANTASPPQTWALANGYFGNGEFSITDVSESVYPFIIAREAPTSSLVINGVGGVAVGAVVPNATTLSALTVGLEKSGSGVTSIGMPAGATDWHLEAASSAFSIYDVASGKRPVTFNPNGEFRVLGMDQATVLVANGQTTNTGSARIMFDLDNASQDRIRFALTAPGGKRWTFDNTPASDTFGISKFGTGKTEFLVNNAGDGKFLRNSIAVNHINTSSRASKADFSSVDSRDILARLTALPVSRWRYKAEGSRQRHIGPVAEDFKQVFNLGDGKTISTVDASGIAFAAIKGLKEEKDLEIAKLTAKNDRELTKLKADSDREIEELKGQMLQLEMMVAELLRKQSSDLDISAVTP